MSRSALITTYRLVVSCRLHTQVEGDQRLPHDSGISVSDDELKQLGLITWTVSDNDEVERFAKERRYVNRDEITVSKKGLGDAYESKIKMFFEEHMRTSSR